MQYVSRAYLEIDGATIECTDIDTTLENGLDRVMTMNRANRAKGFSDGVPQFGFSGTVPVPVDGLPVDLEAMLIDRTEFGATIELEGGAQKIYQQARFASVNFKAADGERGEFSIEVMALNMIPVGA